MGPHIFTQLQVFENHAKTYIYLWNFEDKAMQAFVFVRYLKRCIIIEDLVLAFCPLYIC